VAKEVVVSTMGVLYEVNSHEGTQKSGVLSDALQSTGITPLIALAFLIFVLLYSPCVAAITAIWRETGNWGWALFSVGYQTVLAWGIAFLVIRTGFILGFGV